jgi:Glycosyl hydrolases family 16
MPIPCAAGTPPTPISQHATWKTTVATLASSVLVIASAGLTWSSVASAQDQPSRGHVAKSHVVYPVGIPDTSEPSGEGPPTSDALPGYTLTYETDFPGTKLPAGWDVYSGVPGGDPGGHFGANHVVVSNNTLQLNTYRDPQWGNRWVTGGLCQCGVTHTYGAYFVRSKITSGGGSQVELLWPANNSWPPELDFNENDGYPLKTSSSVHVGANNLTYRRWVNINMMRWHTWGVIWTPSEITYTVDGRVWGTFKAAQDIPNVPMTLDFEQIQQCEEDRECPTSPETLSINWVAEYSSS